MSDNITGQGVSQFQHNNPEPTDPHKYAGENDYTLKEIIIKSPSGGDVDVSGEGVLISCSIYEDLFSNTMSASLSFMDTNNIVKHLPIIGQNEKLTITFKLPWENSEIKELTYEFEIYRVSLRKISSVGKRQVVTLKAVSESQFKNIHTKISKSYYDTIDGMVEEICKDYLGIEKSKNDKNSDGTNLEILEKTDSEKRKFIIPNWRPFDAINWLAERASAEGNGKACHYIFYQNRDGYKFTTVEKLFKVDTPRMEYLYMPRTYRETPTRFRDVGHEMRNIQRLTFEEPGDRLNENIEGMYGSKILTHDIVTKKYEVTSFKLKDEWDETAHTESDYPICRNLDKYSNEEDTVFSFCPIHKNLNMENDRGGETVEQNEKYKEWLLRRKSLLKQLSTHIIKVNVSGDSRRSCGDIVFIKFTPLEPGEEKPLPTDNYITGKYLVTSINHVITRQGYEMNMELSKDSVSEPYPVSSNFLRSQDDSASSSIA